MKIITSISLAATSLIIAGALSTANAQASTSGWPKASQDAIAYMTQKYGAPASVTADVAVWGRTGPWKRTVVYRVEVPHDFPAHHTDVMQQWVDYKAPLRMHDELAMYDGSVVLAPTHCPLTSGMRSVFGRY